MNFNDYQTPLTYPRKDDFTYRYYYKAGQVVAKVGPGEEVSPNVVYSAQERALDEKAYKAAMAEYNESKGRLANAFVVDLLHDHGLPDNEFTRRMYSIAYAQGHSAGLSEVYDCFSDLVDLESLARKVYGK